MLKRILSVSICLLLVLSVFAGCGGKTTPAPAGANGKDPVVVCSIFPLYDFCREIIGSDETLTLLLDSKTDLHNFTPTSDTILKIADADLFVYVGGESDVWVDATVETAKNDHLKTIAALELVNAVEEELLPGMQAEEEEDEGEEEEGPEYDEHVWTSLKNAQTIVRALTKTLCDLAPEQAKTYQSNSDAYIQKLAALEGEYAKTIAEAKRKVLLFADRFPFRYLQKDYDLTCFAAFPGCAAQADVSFETLTTLIERTKEYELPFILVLEGSDGSIAASVSEKTGAAVRVLNSCQSVSPEERANGVTYYSIMADNLAVLKEVLN